MSVTLIQQVGFSSSTPTITLTLNGVAAGNTLIIPFDIGGSAGAACNLTISDNQGNYWNIATDFVFSAVSFHTTGVAYCTAIGGNTTVTVSNTIGQPTAGSLSEWSSGVAGAPLSLDQVASASGSGTSPDSGAATTTNNVELLIGMIFSTGGSISAGSGYTGLSGGSSTNFAEYQITSSSGSYHATATAVSGNWGAVLATFLIPPLPVFNLQVGRFTTNSPIDIVGNLLAPVWQSTNVTPVTVAANSTSDQNLMANIIPANTMNSVGRVLHGVIKGVYSTPLASTATLEFKVKLGTLTLLDITTTANVGSVSGNGFRFDFDIATQTAGSSAVFETSGTLVIDLGAATSTAATVFTDANAAVSSTLDITTNQTLQCTVAFSAGSTSNSCTQRQLILNTIN